LLFLDPFESAEPGPADAMSMSAFLEHLRSSQPFRYGRNASSRACVGFLVCYSVLDHQSLEFAAAKLDEIGEIRKTFNEKENVRLPCILLGLKCDRDLEEGEKPTTMGAGDDSKKYRAVSRRDAEVVRWRHSLRTFPHDFCCH